MMPFFMETTTIEKQLLPVKKSLNESIASVEEQIFEAEQKGNTRKVKALKVILKRLKNLKLKSK